MKVAVVDEERITKLNTEIEELEDELYGLRLEYQKKDTERYNEWNKLMGVYDTKIRIVKEHIDRRKGELDRLEKLRDHQSKHEWIKDLTYNFEQLSFPIQERLKCKVCGKTKMRKVKLLC